MSQKTHAVITFTIGIDTGKNTLHLVGLDDRGTIVLREKLGGSRIRTRLANIPPCLIGIEAGMATHYVARELIALDHDVRQVIARCFVGLRPRTVSGQNLAGLAGIAALLVHGYESAKRRAMAVRSRLCSGLAGWPMGAAGIIPRPGGRRVRVVSALSVAGLHRRAARSDRRTTRRRPLWRALYAAAMPDGRGHLRQPRPGAGLETLQDDPGQRWRRRYPAVAGAAVPVAGPDDAHDEHRAPAGDQYATARSSGTSTDRGKRRRLLGHS